MSAEPFDNAAQAQWRAQIRLLADAEREVAALIEQAARDIRGQLLATPTEWQAWLYPQLQAELDRVGRDLSGRLAGSVIGGLDGQWQAGAALVDQPLAAMGFRLSGAAPVLDTGQLMAMKSFCTDRMRAVTAEAVNNVNTQLGLVMLGARTPGQAVDAIAGVFDGGRARAITIVRTELGTAFSVASQGRLEQALDAGVQRLQKQWRRSRKLHARPSHAVADGQIQDVDKLFRVGGAALRYPRDPKAPLKHRINCGCVQLPYIAQWEVVHPGHLPFSTPELQTRSNRDTQNIRDAGYDSWVKSILSGKVKPGGHFETIGTLPADVVEKLALRGKAPLSADIVISDYRIRHMDPGVREHKTIKGMPADMIGRLPGLLDQPAAILWDKKKNNLVYVLDIPGTERKAVLPIGIRDADPLGRRKPANWITTNIRSNLSTLADQHRYERFRWTY